MEAWINSYSENQIKYLADSKFELLDATGLEIDLSGAGLGKDFPDLPFLLIMDL